MQHPFYKRQKGFTLLELLVVITLLAVLAVGALVAYEGVGDQASATAAANNTATVDRAVRNYRAVTKAYPDQWDNLSALDSANGFNETMMAPKTLSTFASFDASADTDMATAINNAFSSVGIKFLQSMNANATTAGVAPNLQHNEGANPNNVDEEDVADGFLSVMPSNNGTACTFGGQAWTLFDNTVTPTSAVNNTLNKINDHLEADECHLVVALGFGHDAAHSTTDKSVAIAQAPTYSSKTLNPASHYARYVGLFHLASQGSGINIDDDDIVEHGDPTLIAVVDTEGNPIDVNLMTASEAK